MARRSPSTTVALKPVPTNPLPALSTHPSMKAIPRRQEFETVVNKLNSPSFGQCLPGLKATPTPSNMVSAQPPASLAATISNSKENRKNACAHFLKPTFASFVLNHALMVSLPKSSHRPAACDSPHKTHFRTPHIPHPACLHRASFSQAKPAAEPVPALNPSQYNLRVHEYGLASCNSWVARADAFVL